MLAAEQERNTARISTIDIVLNHDTSMQRVLVQEYLESLLFRMEFRNFYYSWIRERTSNGQEHDLPMV